jgi:tyrosyl-tRNA synthetase
MFGKVMSISDELMWRYYELLTDLAPSEIDGLKSQAAEGKNPRDLKVDLAKLIIKDFHSGADANAAEEDFVRQFVQKEVPDDIELKRVTAGDHKLTELLVDVGLASSKGEAKRLIEQGGVRIDGEKASNSGMELSISETELLVQVGKRKFLRIAT